ncbi:MAG: dipeptidase [Planctomycetota bacterium]
MSDDGGVEFLADWHMDVLSCSLEQGHDLALEGHLGHADVPRLRKAGFGLSGWSLYWPPGGKLGPADSIRAQLALAHSLEKSGAIRIVRGKKDLEGMGSGPLKVLLHLEGCKPLEAGQIDWDWAFGEGVRSLSLTWNERNEFASGTGKDVSQAGGLTARGRELVKWCRSKGVMVDIAHLADGGVDDLLEFDCGMLIATHANCRHLAPWVRNLRDEVIKELHRRGGTIGVVLVPDFMTSKPSCHVDDMKKHLARLVELGGPELPSSGSDLDGTSLPAPLKDVLDYGPVLREWAREFGEGLLSANMVRVLKNVLPT